MEPRTARALVEAAFAAGVRVFDTAPYYADGGSERLLGRSLAGARDRAFLVTKFKGADARRSCEGSLRRLRTDRVDALVCQGYDRAVGLERLLETFASLLREGKIRNFGFCGLSGEELRLALRLSRDPGLRGRALVQGELSLAAPEGARTARDCARAGAPFIAFSALAAGLLVRDKPAHGRYLELPTGRLARARAAVARRARRAGLSPAAAALAWTLARPGVSSVVLGARTESQLRDALAGAAEARA